VDFTVLLKNIKGVYKKIALCHEKMDETLKYITVNRGGGRGRRNSFPSNRVKRRNLLSERVK